MQVSLSWLKEYVPVSLPVAELAESLTMTGFEVEQVVDRYAYLAGAVVALVKSVAPHPDSDHLSVCQVDAGGRILSLVCGAPNVKKDMLAVLVEPGFELPSGAVIKKNKIRGVVSEGMLCSQAELGIGDDGAGIMEINRTVGPGTPLTEALALNDAVLEISLTPNRPDCLSIIGIAREVAAFSRQKLTLPEIHLSEGPRPSTDFAGVDILAPELCSRYVARVVLDVVVGESPFWLRDRLLSVGLKPINNIVDITNFVMMETGQPLHAFDLDRLAGNRIVVRQAGADSSFTTLDQKERRLNPEMLMICDAEKPVAVAGIMGGLNSEISEGTTRVLIESACFQPTSVRKTSKLLNISSDAAYRFERGVDPLGGVFAADRAAQLMAELAGGTIARGMIDNHPLPAVEKKISVSAEAINRRLGTAIGVSEMAGLLETVAFSTIPTEEGLLQVGVPSFRVDVDRPEDISEEVARLWGYNRIPVTFPAISGDSVRTSPMFDQRARLREIMTGFGFSEVVTYSFIGEAACVGMDMLRIGDRLDPVRVLNPLAADQSTMRTSLLPGLLASMRHNLSQQIADMKIFETGRVFWPRGSVDELPEEPEMMAALLTGAVRPRSWQGAEEPGDFFDIKGALECLLMALGVSSCRFSVMPRERCIVTRPGHTARVSFQAVEVGLVGEVARETLEKFDIKKPAFVFELNVSALAPLLSDHIEARVLSKFPSVSRDITMIVDHTVEAGRVLNFLEQSDDNLIEKIEVLDVYEGEAIPAGKKSLSFRIVYRSQETTLKDVFVNRIHGRIADRLLQTFSAELPV